MMTIDNLKDRYIKIESDTINVVFNDPSSYTDIIITAKTSCAGEEVTDTITSDDLINAGWFIDLGVPTGLQNQVFQLYLKNLVSLKEFGVITTAIDLGYVADHCTADSCTLQDFQTAMAVQFKSQIDSYLNLYGFISHNCTVVFQGNTMVITGLPAGVVPSRITYGVMQGDNEGYFSYGKIGTNFIIDDQKILLAPQFFGDDTLQDGVYTVTIRFDKANGAGYTEETNCSFIDVLTKCKIAPLIRLIIESGYSSEVESLMLLHYGLKIGSNCGCNCNDLCQAYNDLLDLLNQLVSDPNITNTDCGC